MSQWTTETPTRPGWYWVATEPRGTTERVDLGWLEYMPSGAWGSGIGPRGDMVFEGGHWMCNGAEIDQDMVTHWWGPLLPPDPPEGTP